MGDTNFLKKLQDYDTDHIPESTLKKLKGYVDNKDFKPEIVAKVSKVCKSMCMWVRAIDEYAKVFKVVAPKKKKYVSNIVTFKFIFTFNVSRVEEAEKELNSVMAVLMEKQRQLAEVEAMIDRLEQQFEESVAEKQALEDNMDLTANRLSRAGRLNIALGDEQIRWEQSVEVCGYNQRVFILLDIIHIKSNRIIEYSMLKLTSSEICYDKIYKKV